MSTGAKPHTSPAAKREAAADNSPIIVDMGEKKRKDIRRLRKGKDGKLMHRLEETIEHLKESGAIRSTVQPIVIVVQERRRTRRMSPHVQDVETGIVKRAARR